MFKLTTSFTKIQSLLILEKKGIQGQLLLFEEDFSEIFGWFM